MKISLAMLNARGFITARVPTRVSVHPAERCTSKKAPLLSPSYESLFCGIHAPSAHPLRAAERVLFNASGRPLFLRVCKHDQVHTDPDEETYLMEYLGVSVNDLLGQHRKHCDGCCITSVSPRQDRKKRAFLKAKQAERDRIDAEVVANLAAHYERTMTYSWTGMANPQSGGNIFNTKVSGKLGNWTP